MIIKTAKLQNTKRINSNEIIERLVVITDINDKQMTVPFSSSNIEYQAYLSWLAEGNEPLPADEPEGQTA
jgi:hypothetical protein